jgi:hypothetical protein
MKMVAFLQLKSQLRNATKAYAFDPSLCHFIGNEMTIDVKYEVVAWTDWERTAALLRQNNIQREESIDLSKAKTSLHVLQLRQRF